MILEIILALIIGIIIGTLTGLAPGIHINLVAAITLSSLPLLAFISPLSLAIFITAVAITHTCVDFIPSIYLGAPEEDTYLVVLPGHELLKQGKAHEAVLLAMFGIIIGFVLSILFIAFFVYISPLIQKALVKIVAFVLILISSFMILREEKWKIALLVFLMAGFLGYASLNLPIKEPLLPLLTGLFGASSLLLSIKSKTKIPSQKINKIKEMKIPKKETRNAFLGTLITLPIFSILPALGSGYAALTASEILNQTRKGFLILSGAINTSIMISSFILVYSIGKSRTGAAAAINNILPSPSFQNSLSLLSCLIVATMIAVVITIYISKRSASLISKINYNLLSKLVILVMLSVTLIISNWQGILVLITSASLGVFAITSNIKRTHLMASLIVPTIIYYLT